MPGPARARAAGAAHRVGAGAPAEAEVVAGARPVASHVIEEQGHLKEHDPPRRSAETSPLIAGTSGAATAAASGIPTRATRAARATLSLLLRRTLRLPGVALARQPPCEARVPGAPCT